MLEFNEIANARIVDGRPLDPYPIINYIIKNSNLE